MLQTPIDGGRSNGIRLAKRTQVPMGTRNCDQLNIPRASHRRPRGQNPENGCCERRWPPERAWQDFQIGLHASTSRIQRLAHRDRSGPITVEERKKAALVLIKVAQKEAFGEELKWLSQTSQQKLRKTHKMYELDPFLEDGVLRVGGRLRWSSASLEFKQPVILPKEGIVTQLILDHCHKRTQHRGRGQTLNELRANRYWLMGASKVVAKHIKSCVT